MSDMVEYNQPKIRREKQNLAKKNNKSLNKKKYHLGTKMGLDSTTLAKQKLDSFIR